VAKKKWSDLTESQKRAVVVGGVVETIVTVAALRDLAQRSAGAVRGPRAAWALGMFVQPFGPIAYFAAGRR
jgi:hypothetical protein